MSSAARATESPRHARPATFVPLALIALCGLIHPGLMIYTQHVDDRYTEEPFSSLLMIGFVAPFVIVLAAILMLLIAQTWPTTELVALPLLVVGWLVPLYVAPLNFGCSDVGGVAQPCGVDAVSAAREVVALVIAALVASIAVWLRRRFATIYS